MISFPFARKRKRNILVVERKARSSHHSFSRLFSPPRFVGVVIVLLFGICFGIFALFFSPWIRITSVSIEGTETISEETIEQVVREHMYGNLFNVIPRDTYFLFPQQELQEVLAERFPRISSLRFDKKFPHEITAYIEERSIVGMWCTKTGGLARGAIIEGDCAFFDNQGIIFEEAPAHTKGTLFFLVEDFRKDQTLELGSQVLEEDIYTFIDELKGGLKNVNLVASLYRLWTDNEVRVQFRGWEAYFSTQYHPVYQAQILSDVLEEEIGRESPFLEYVDLRIKNKVFYKFRDLE